MYCPNCTAPIDEVKFCRQCGANVSFVSQAMSGQFVAPDDKSAEPSLMRDIGRRYGRILQQCRQEKPPSETSALKKCFMALGFAAVGGIVLKHVPGGLVWDLAVLTPMFGCLGAGLSELLRAIERNQRLAALPSLPLQQAVQPSQRQVPTTSELMLPASLNEVSQPVSITEHTTALLDAARPKISND